jgi:two-component system alkaline phosphatase synthesis response regulator PhoP
MRVLVIEDDEAIGRLLRITFERDGQDVAHATTATEGLNLLRDWAPDVVVLDLMLPDISGFDVTRKIREDSDVPIVIVTARAQENDRVAGLDLGADDYIVKPFSLLEVAARVRAVARRTGGELSRRPGGSLTHRELTLDPREHRVLLGGEDLKTTKREFEILRMLMQQSGKLVTRSAIAHAVWGRTATSAKNLLDVHLHALRKKLEVAGDGAPYIETVRGEGFRLN